MTHFQQQGYGKRQGGNQKQQRHSKIRDNSADARKRADKGESANEKTQQPVLQPVDFNERAALAGQHPPGKGTKIGARKARVFVEPEPLRRNAAAIPRFRRRKSSLFGGELSGNACADLLWGKRRANAEGRAVKVFPHAPRRKRPRLPRRRADCARHPLVAQAFAVHQDANAVGRIHLIPPGN